MWINRAIGWLRPHVTARPAAHDSELPGSLFRFIFTHTGLHQALLSLLTILVFLLDLSPLELQRRIVNGLVENRDYSVIVLLAGAYVAAMLSHGALKFGLNVYRGRVGECIVRYLRSRINTLVHQSSDQQRAQPPQASAFPWSFQKQNR